MLLLQSVNMEKRAFTLNFSKHSNPKTSSWSMINCYLREVENIAFQRTRDVCFKSKAGRFGRGEEFFKYSPTLGN